MEANMLPMSYMPGDPSLIDNIVWELKSQGIFDSFRKECIADVDTKPAYQNLRQRVDGSVSTFLKKQVWSPDLNKNQLREKLRKYIYQSGFLETGVERIVDQVVNPKMNSVFLQKVTDVVYQYLGLAKPESKSPEEKENELKVKTEELLPKELEAVSPESQHDDKNDDSNQSFDDLKIDEEESPPFEPLDEENSVDSHMSGISGLQSHDSDLSVKALNVENMQISVSNTEDSSNTSTALNNNTDKVDSDQTLEKVEVEPPKEQLEHDSNSPETFKVEPSTRRAEENNDKDKEKEKEKPKSESKERKPSSSSSSKSKYKDKELKSGDKDKDKDRKHSKDGHRSSSTHHSDRKKDSRHSKDKRDDKDHKSKSRSDHKSSKSSDNRSRSRHDSERKSSSSRSDKDKDKGKRLKDKKDDHYSAKHKSERRSTDRDSNDGSGLKSSSSSYCDSNSSTNLSQKGSTSQDSGKNKNSDSNQTKQQDHESCVYNKHLKEVKTKEIMTSNEPTNTISVSVASWDALEAQLNTNLNSNLEPPAKKAKYGLSTEETGNLRYFNTNFNDEIITETSSCISKLIEDIEDLETGRRTTRDLRLPFRRESNTKEITDSQCFHLPPSPSESDSDKQSDKKSDTDGSVSLGKRKNITATQRYTSEDLYKPRPLFKRTSTRRRTAVNL